MTDKAEELHVVESDEPEMTLEELELSEKKLQVLERLQEAYGQTVAQVGECSYRIYSMEKDREILLAKARDLNVEASSIAKEAKQSQAKRAKAMAKRLSKMKKVENGGDHPSTPVELA